MTRYAFDQRHVELKDWSSGNLGFGHIGLIGEIRHAGKVDKLGFLVCGRGSGCGGSVSLCSGHEALYLTPYIMRWQAQMVLYFSVASY